MKVVFVHRGGPDFASYRYRAQIPAVHLNGPDIKASVNEGDADILIFSKPMEQDIELLHKAKMDCTPVVVDFCDDHFDHPQIGPVYRVFLEDANRVTCPTDHMAKRIKEFDPDMTVHVIADPYEFERQKPHANGQRVLWYGHQRNVTEIMPFVDKIDELSVVTGPTNLITGYIPWTAESLKDELAYNNIVLLPGCNEAKSTNRLINAIMAGCFVIADHTEARNEFRRFAWVGPVYTGLQFAKAERSMLNDLVAEGQDYIEKHYSPVAIANEWADLLKDIWISYEMEAA